MSFLFRRDTRAEWYRPHLAGKLLIVSFMTVAELDRWALEHNWGPTRQANLAHHLQGFVMYPATRALCRTWAEIMSQARRRGKPISTADA